MNNDEVSDDDMGSLFAVRDSSDEFFIFHNFTVEKVNIENFFLIVTF